MRFIDWPQPARRDDYERTVRDTLVRLRSLPGLRAVYQIGHVTHPGISDIDLVVVFEDDTLCRKDPREGLPPLGRYLLVHDLWGINHGQLARAGQFTLFHNYQLIEGRSGVKSLSNPEDHASPEITRQVALEYLLKIYASMCVERRYGVVKIRNLLLHAKALLFDCEFLGEETGEFRQAIETVVAWRQRWFEDRPAQAELKLGIAALQEQLGLYLGSKLCETPICLPARSQHRLAGNISLVRDSSLRCDHRGFLLPGVFSGLGRKYFNLLHRFNHFTIHLPSTTENVPLVIQEKFAYESDVRTLNSRQFPRFMPFISGINYL